jgi:hypothetical protein
VAKGLARLAALCGAILLAAPAYAAAPNYILVSGRGLAHPVLLADWRQNLKLLLAVGDAPRAGRAAAGLASRPRFDLAEYWGWGGRPPPRRPAQASQHGTFYPAQGSTRAVVVLQVQGIRIPRLAPAFLLRVLARNGVPTRV